MLIAGDMLGAGPNLGMAMVCSGFFPYRLFPSF
jgi:hypothetical protein